jgi:hypothetical protein
MVVKGGEKIKIYLVIALSIIFVISFYFRFIQANTNESKLSVHPQIPSARLNIPKIDPVLLRDTQDQNVKISDESQTVLRDIFSPVHTPSRAAEKKDLPQSEPVAPTPLPSFRLKGTIVGPKGSIAIIDNQFLRSGDRIGRYRVAKIGKKNVLLDSGDRTILLEILKND